MYINQYIRKINEQLILLQSAVYNVHQTKEPFRIQLNASFNTFSGERNLKLVKLYNLILYLTNQRPYLKKVKFNYKKKKILKRFILVDSLSLKNTDNFLNYLVHNYLYFFHIYYQKPLKYNILKNRLVLYLDNPQFFIKNYNKHQQRFKLKILFTFKNKLFCNQFIRTMSNFFLIKVK